MMAMSLACFVSSLSLETALLLRYEEHVKLVVASLVIVALLSASCCMGLLVWWKGPQWADDDRDAAAWVHEHRPSRHSVPPQVRTPRRNQCRLPPSARRARHHASLCAAEVCLRARALSLCHYARHH